MQQVNLRLQETNLSSNYSINELVSLVSSQVNPLSVQAWQLLTSSYVYSSLDMSGQTIEVAKPKSQQDSHQQESTCPNLDDVVKALQNRPPLPDVSSQGISTQPFYLHESHPHQADISLPPATMSVNTQPQQHTDFSVSSAGGHKIDREPVVASEPATVPHLEPAVDDGPILSQGNPISAEQPSLTSADSRSESQPSAALRVHAPFWKVWWQEILCIVISYASLLGKQACGSAIAHLESTLVDP